MKRIEWITFSLLLLTNIFNLSCTYEDVLAKRQQIENQQSGEKILRSVALVPLAPTYESGRYAFQDLAILNKGRVWAVGYDGVNLQKIRFSGDAGATWESRIISSDFSMVNSIFFIDDLYGWAAGNGEIYRTTDGGERWSKTDLKRYLVSTSISFYDRKIGYLVGRLNIKGEEASEVWMTRDGGATWAKTYESKKWPTPFSVIAISENTALLILDEATLVRTDDGGKNWSAVDSYEYPTDQLYKDKNGRIWAVGREGNFVYSLDRGGTWKRPEKFPQQLISRSWNSIGFIDQSRGFAVGDGGALAKTEDGGTTWEYVESKTDDDLLRLFVNRNLSLIIGSDKLYRLDALD